MNQREDLTPKQRIQRYLNGEIVDRLPCSLMMTETAAPYLGYKVNEYFFDAEKIAEVEAYKVHHLSFESAGVSVTLRGIGEAMGSEISYPSDRAGSVKVPILQDYKDFDRLPYINPSKDGRLPIVMDAVARTIDKVGDIVDVGTSVPGPFTAAHAIRGTNQLIIDLIRRPEELDQLLKFVVENTLIFVKAMYEKNGVSCSIADPMCSNAIIRPSMFEERVFPHLKNLVDGIYEITGQKPSLHICGKTKQIWKALRKLNIASFSIDNVEDLYEAKIELGDQFLLIGNVDPVDIIHFGEREDVLAEAKNCIDKCIDNPSGFFLSSGCDIPSHTKIENILAMSEASKLYSQNCRLGM
ncbi:uroporphyrinogen decarboxylase family protein [Facklamia languida]